MLMDEGYVAVEDGLRLYYRVVGTGSRVILMPPACWLAADLEPLAAGLTLIFYDQRMSSSGLYGSQALSMMQFSPCQSEMGKVTIAALQKAVESQAPHPV